MPFTHKRLDEPVVGQMTDAQVKASTIPVIPEGEFVPKDIADAQHYRQEQIEKYDKSSIVSFRIREMINQLRYLRDIIHQ